MRSACPNCGSQVSPETRICLKCGFPLSGSPSEERAYNVLLLDMKSWMEEAQKAIRSLLSFAIIFLLIGLVVVFFSFLLHYDFYVIALYFFILSICYLAFHYLARTMPYKAVFLAFIFYALHTVYEFSTGMILKDFIVGKEQVDFFSVVFKYAPFVYIVFRLLLLSAFIRGIYFILKIEKHSLMAGWLSGKKSQIV